MSFRFDYVGSKIREGSPSAMTFSCCLAICFAVNGRI